MDTKAFAGIVIYFGYEGLVAIMRFMLLEADDILLYNVNLKKK